MELKLNRGESVMIIIPLLIVPYGIETKINELVRTFNNHF